MKSSVRRSGGPTPPNGPRRPPTTPTAPARRADARAFVTGVVAEMKRVTWPTREEWIGATILTIALVVGVGLFTGAVDWILAVIFSWLTGTAR